MDILGAITNDKSSGGKTQLKNVGGPISGTWSKAAERKHPAYGCRVRSLLSVSCCGEVEAPGSEHARHHLVKINDPLNNEYI